jgi:hypothetical protein
LHPEDLGRGEEGKVGSRAGVSKRGGGRDREEKQEAIKTKTNKVSASLASLVSGIKHAGKLS